MERRIRNMSVISVVLLVMATLFAGITAFLTIKTDEAEIEVLKRQYASYLLADELRQSSDDLTRLARTYVITGDAAYEEQYLDILAIRNGEKERPENYHLIYWDFVAAGRDVSPGSGLTRSLMDLMRDEGFTEAEFDKLAEAQANSDGLVQMEIKAMNAVKGIFADQNGEYTVTGEPDFAMARELLHSPEYHAYKADIMKPVAEFFLLMEERLSTEINTLETYAQLETMIFIVSILILMLVTAGVGFIIFSKIMRPLGSLTEVMTELANGATDVEVPCQGQSDEFGILARQTALFKANSDKVSGLMEEAERSSAKANEQMEAAKEQQAIADKQREEANAQKEIADAQKLAALELQKEVERVVASAKDGDFATRVTVDSNDEASARIAEGMNGLMGRLDDATGKIVIALKALGEGKVDVPMKLDAAGRFAEIETTAEDARERLGDLINQFTSSAEAEKQSREAVLAQQEKALKLQGEIDTLLDEAKNGIFTGRINVDGQDAASQRIASSMNTLMERLDATMTEIINLLKAFGRGDLTASLSLNNSGRFGEMETTAQTARQMLSDLISTVASSVADTQKVIDGMRKDANSVSRSMQNQAASVEETSAAMVEMSDRINESAQQLESSSKLTSSVMAKTATGKETVGAVVTAVENIKASSDRIAETISVIETISFQTNLLALNASVEAARAGEAGRGFAVVASEVRELALRCATAATDISAVIAETSEGVDQGVNLVHKAGASLDEIAEAIETLRENIEAVNATGSEQAVSAQEIQRAVEEISRSTQTTAGSSEHTADIADGLFNSVQELREKVSSFKTATSPAQSFRKAS